MHRVEKTAIGSLVGAKLVLVQFVRDYLILGLGELGAAEFGLTTITRPTVLLGATRFNWDAPGYRDALCSLLGASVERVDEDDRALLLEFSDDRSIAISLLLEDSVDVEVAILQGPNHELTVWQVRYA